MQDLVNGDSSIESAADYIVDHATHGHVNFDTVEEIARAIENWEELLINVIDR